MDNIIKIKDLKFKYENTYVLDEINIEIKKGTWTSIVGHNGSGKSTLSKLLVGIITDYSGEIYIDNVLVNEDTIDDLRSKISIVFQNPDNQFVGTTVKDDIAFGLENNNVETSKMEEIIENTLKKVDMLEYINKEPHKLSGGQKQRVAIASILALNTDIIILDEATSMLDPEGRKEVLDIIKELKKLNKTIITITHDLEETLFSDEIIVLNKGKLVNKGSIKEIFENEQILQESKLDILESMKLIKLAKKSSLLKNNIELMEELCKLNLKM